MTDDYENLGGKVLSFWHMKIVIEMKMVLSNKSNNILQVLGSKIWPFWSIIQLKLGYALAQNHFKENLYTLLSFLGVHKGLL